MRLHEFVAMATRLGVYRLLVSPVVRTTDAGDPSLLPLSAPSNQRRRDKRRHVAVYDAQRHGPKPHVTFDRPVYHAYDVFLVLTPQLPKILYPRGSERSPERPTVLWPDEPALRRWRRAGRARAAAMRHRVTAGDERTAH